MIKEFKELFGRAAGQDEKLITRREALTKTSCIALSAATMMVLMKSQPAKAQSSQSAKARLQSVTSPTKTTSTTIQSVAYERTSRY